MSSVLTSLSAWWSAWRYVVLLLVLLLLSVAGNVWQAYRAMTRPARVENAALTRALDQITGIAERRDRDDAQLIASLQSIADRGQQVRTIYRTAAAQAPLDGKCAPGQARVDAVNAALGPITGESK